MKYLDKKICNSTHLLGVFFCAVVFILGRPFCFADTCPDNMQPTPTGNEETLASAYQPPLPDDAKGVLHRYRFVPPNAGPNDKFPTVLMLPPDLFNLEYGDHGVPSERGATYDLQQAGFLVFQVEHRLAPPNHLPGQHTYGHPPDQTDDFKRQILAALADPRCNGRIYLVGGSAGGCLALWCALDSATGAVTGWDNNARLKIKAVVSLSGVTNLDDWSNPGGIGMADLLHFENSCDNYVGLPDQDHTHGPLLAASPVSLVSTATSSPPVMLYACQGDPVPYAQAQDMATALTTKFPLIEVDLNILSYTIDGTDHAYLYWHELNTNTQICVSHEVIAFLQRYP